MTDHKDNELEFHIQAALIMDIFFSLAVSGPVHEDHFPLPAVCGRIPECLLAGQGDGDKSRLCWLYSESEHQQQGHRHQTLASGQSSEWSRYW